MTFVRNFLISPVVDVQDKAIHLLASNPLNSMTAKTITSQGNNLLCASRQSAGRSRSACAPRTARYTAPYPREAARTGTIAPAQGLPQDSGETRLLICLFLAITFFAGSLGLAQETRVPIERYSFEVEASSPSDIIASVDAAGKIAVWSNYSEKVDRQGNYLSFGAKKFQTFERGKQIKTTQDLKDIPRKESVGLQRLVLLSGIGWMPSGGIERDNKITFRKMTKLVFNKETFIVGPFEYTIRWATPLGLDKAGFLYVVAECSKLKDTAISSPDNLRIFKMLYKINKNG